MPQTAQGFPSHIWQETLALVAISSTINPPHTGHLGPLQSSGLSRSVFSSSQVQGSLPQLGQQVQGKLRQSGQQMQGSCPQSGHRE